MDVQRITSVQLFIIVAHVSESALGLPVFNITFQWMTDESALGLPVFNITFQWMTNVIHWNVSYQWIRLHNILVLNPFNSKFYLLRIAAAFPRANNESSEVIDILLPVTFYFNPSTRLDNVRNLWRLDDISFPRHYTDIIITNRYGM